MAALTHLCLTRIRDQGPHTGGKTIKRVPGELVNASMWRTLQNMVTQERITTIPDGIEPVRSVDGRWFVDRATLESYGFRQERPAPAPEIQRNGAVPDGGDDEVEVAEASVTATCGDFGGLKADGEPCGRDAGWGTDEQTGRCKNHREGSE